MKIVTIVGARPQFIKAAAVSRAIRQYHAESIQEIIVHTGQHYNDNMSKVFFDELEIPAPQINLEISGGTHGVMTGRMLEGIEQVLLQEKPDWVLIYGDTNSTLAGALAAVKLHIPVAHVEAGLRSFNRRMPEEINRILADRVSTLLFCPTETAVANLKAEGMVEGVHNAGDVMYDVALFFQAKAKTQSTILERLNLSPQGFALATCHRAENTDDKNRLTEIIVSLAELSKQFNVVFPIHPRTAKLIHEYGLNHHLANITVVEPLAFLDMIALEQSAKFILTDSGGVQKEAFFYNVPCLTMRDETEWVETVACGANALVGADCAKIMQCVQSLHTGKWQTRYDVSPYGDGRSAAKILDMLSTFKALLV